MKKILQINKILLLLLEKLRFFFHISGIRMTIKGLAPGLIIFILAIIIFPCAALADGGLMRYDLYADRWDHIPETSQQAFINYENGREKLIIAIEPDANNSGSLVWYFPIPANPEDIQLDVLSDLPNLQGEEINALAKKNLDGINNALLDTQIYTLPFQILFSSFMGVSTSDFAVPNENIGGTLKGGLESDVQVYQHLEKEGITSEIVSAKTSGGLVAYLESKGLKLSRATLPSLDYYLGKNYSFVVSWINGEEKTLGANTDLSVIIPPYMETNFDIFPSQQPATNRDLKGVFVTFPAKQLYFPLLPTSIYKEKNIPATIKVVGLVTPKTFPGIRDLTVSKYYYQDVLNLPSSLENFTSKTKDLTYTKVEINAPAQNYTEDLGFYRAVPLRIYGATFMTFQPIITFILIMALYSMMAALISGYLVFPHLRKEPFYLARIGLFNFLTIIGLAYASFYIKPINEETNNDTVPQLLTKYYKPRKIMASLLNITGFTVLGLIAFTTWVSIGSIDIHFMKVFIIALAITFILFVFGHLILRVNDDDKANLRELEAKGYSLLSLKPVSQKNIYFIILFSILFLVITYLGDTFMRIFL